ncbi:hypothetical protein SmJEL517_g04291 [Synchytrium microbalum]|uniref:Uncharacterized protein n=1 Tax=Synchytrium microbalum TaxID=1806994 RepID=A0A507BZS1_9FUNG|nr:uncharacterized protein SmJEL517_g04291 [Synchytrium microbalum]TPX32621.1 hypothetical protein SmJEL517_g04291 [Synchytrium microbalum]
MLSKIFVTLLAASSAIVSVSADAKYYGDDDYYKDDYYQDDGFYKDDYYTSPKVVEKEVIIEKFLPHERIEHYGPYVEVLEKEAAFKSMKYPEVVYPKVAQKEEFSDGHLEVKYLEKYPPQPQGAIIFPSEYAKYETHSEGPHVPHFKPRKIYADVFEKQFVCPKFEKVVYVTIPGKCTCEPINVHPKVIKAPRLIHDGKHFDGPDDYYGHDDEVTTIKEFKEVRIIKEDDKKWWYVSFAAENLVRFQSLTLAPFQ